MTSLAQLCRGNNVSAVSSFIFRKLTSESNDELLSTLEEVKEEEGAVQTLTDGWVDALWLHSCRNPDDLDLCIASAKQLMENHPDSRTKLLETLDSGLVEKLELSPADVLVKKTRLYNTQANYKQQKYNIMAEESEGFAKLLTLLLGPPVDDPALAVRQLCQVFRLDPNRCLDLALHCLVNEEEEDKKQQLLAIIKNAMPTNKICSLIHFALQADESPRARLLSVSWLIHQDVIHAADFWEFLWGPEEDEMLQTMYAKSKEIATKKVQSMSKVSLSSSSKKNSVEETVDLSSLSSSLAIEWCKILLDEFPPVVWVPLLGEDAETEWSKVFFLFPKLLGSVVCRFLEKNYVKPWLLSVPSQHVVIPPWTELTDEIEQKIPSLETIYNQVLVPLFLLDESGCIGELPEFFGMLCRLLSYYFQDDVPTKLKAFIESFLLPSSSLFAGDPTVSHEMWRVLEPMPFPVRYKLYEAWRGSGLEKAAIRSMSKPLWLIEGEMQAGKDVRYALKRLSKDTIIDMSRAVARVCYGYPLVVFTTILNQIESYDNLIEVMVNALKFVTPLSLDVLGFCILSRLSGSGGGSFVNRSRLKEDGTNVSQWLQSLETFAGAFYKSFPFVEFRGILAYLMNRIKDGHVMELGVLRALLKNVGGWAFADYAPAASLSRTQLEGRAGSTLLRRETMSFGVTEDTSEKSSSALRAVLQENDIGVCLLVLLTQVRYQILFTDKDEAQKPVKLVGNLYDTCQVTISILLDFLTVEEQHESLCKLAESLPPMAELHSSYKVDVPSAWMIARPLIRAADTLDLTEPQNAALEKFKSNDKSLKTYEGTMLEDTWMYLTVELFEVFYSSTLYDMFHPGGVYMSELTRMDKEIERLEKNRKGGIEPQPGLQNSMVHPDLAIKRLTELKVQMKEEAQKQRLHVKGIREVFDQKKSGFFVEESSDAMMSMSTFLSACVNPRCMQSPDDALYCAKFIFLLHEVETPGFHTLHLLDRMFLSMSKALFGTTEGEAANVSILFSEAWTIVSRWRYDEQAFKTQVVDKPGGRFATSEDGELEDVTADSYKRLYDKWHAAIGNSCFGSLQSEEYMHNRCCLILLGRMVEVFPTKPKLGNRLIRALEPLQGEACSFPDIRAAAQAYGMQLVKARDDGVWKEEDAATVAARQQKEKDAARARQEKAEKRMEEMKRESQKISEEIGDRDRRFRDDRRSPHPQDSRGRPPARDMDEGRWPGRGVPSRGNESNPRGRGVRAASEDRGRPEGRGLEGRWQAPTPPPSNKRNRPLSPTGDDTHSGKRNRSSSLEPGEEAPKRRRRGGGRR